MHFSTQFLKCIPLFFLILIATYNNSIIASGYGFFEDLESRKIITDPFEFKVNRPILATQSEPYNKTQQHQGNHSLSKKSSCHSFEFVEDTMIHEDEIVPHQHQDEFIQVERQEISVVESMLPPNNKKRKNYSVIGLIAKFLCQS